MASCSQHTITSTTLPWSLSEAGSAAALGGDRERRAQANMTSTPAAPKIARTFAREERSCLSSRFMNMTIDEVKLSVITQIHARSKVVGRKFRTVQRSLDFLFISLLLYVLSYIIAGIS